MLYLCIVVSSHSGFSVRKDNKYNKVFLKKKEMEEKKYKGYWIVDIERWEYIWMGEEPAPQFPHRLAIRKGVYFYLKGSLKRFPKRLYRVLKNVFTKSLKLSQAPSGYLANNKEGKCGTVSE